jgi:hypothetical protein
LDGSGIWGVDMPFEKYSMDQHGKSINYHNTQKVANISQQQVFYHFTLAASKAVYTVSD